MSTSHYIPPHMRNRKRPAENLKKEEKPIIVESEFPSISTQTTNTRTFNGPSFRDMAATTPEVLSPPHKNPELKLQKRGNIRRRNMNSMTYDYYPEPEQVEQLLPEKEPENDGWTTVERKVIVKKDKVQQALDTGNLSYGEEEETSWGNEQEEDEDSFWIDRKY
jgi:hypothetical protein